MADNKKNLPPEDDGETIVDMNVDGMPWYDPRLKNRDFSSSERHYEMTREELRAYRWAAVKSGLIIALIFGAAFAAFIAFCDFVWFA